MTEEDILNRIERFCQEAGGQAAYARKVGVNPSFLSDYIKKRKKVKNMTIGTLFKIFPHAVIVFSPEKTQRNVYSDEKKECIAQSEYQHKLETLEKDRQLFELETENWRLKREIEEIGKNEGVPDLLRR